MTTPTGAVAAAAASTDALPAEVVKLILEHAARTDAATALKLSCLSRWARAALKPTLHAHFRILHVSERTLPRFLAWLTGDAQAEVRDNVRALAIDHTALNIFDDDANAHLPPGRWPNPDHIRAVIAGCTRARSLFIDTTSLHAFADHAPLQHISALTICAAHLPPDEREWAHMPFPPAGCSPYVVDRLHLCPLGSDALDFRALPVSLDATHLAITYPIMPSRAPPGRPMHEYLSRQVVLALLRASNFHRLIIRGSPHMLLRIARQLLSPPRHFNFVLDPEMDEVELFESLHDREGLMQADRIRLRLWPPPDADSALFTPNFEGNLVYPQMFREWKDAAAAQLDDEDARVRGQYPPRSAAAGPSRSTKHAFSSSDADADNAQPEHNQPILGAPWDDEDGDLCGITQENADALERLIAQYPQYHPLPSNPWLSAVVPFAAAPVP